MIDVWRGHLKSWHYWHVRNLSGLPLFFIFFLSFFEGGSRDMGQKGECITAVEE